MPELMDYYFVFKPKKLPYKQKTPENLHLPEFIIYLNTYYIATAAVCNNLDASTYSNPWAVATAL